MSTVSVCPSAVFEAPIDLVWELMTQPGGFDGWTDATMVSAEPEGPAQPGQRLHLVTRALGLTFAVTIAVREVDAERHRLHLVVSLPFGLVNDELVTMTDVGDGRTLIRFG